MSKKNPTHVSREISKTERQIEVDLDAIAPYVSAMMSVDPFGDKESEGLMSIFCNVTFPTKGNFRAHAPGILNLTPTGSPLSHKAVSFAGSLPTHHFNTERNFCHGFL